MVLFTELGPTEVASWRVEMMTSGEKCRKRWTDCTRKKVKVVQSCPTLCDTKDYTVHGIL